MVRGRGCPPSRRGGALGPSIRCLRLNIKSRYFRDASGGCASNFDSSRWGSAKRARPKTCGELARPARAPRGSGLGEANRPIRALEPTLPELFFELADLGAHTGLSDMDAQRGFGDAFRLSYGDETVQLPELQRVPLALIKTRDWPYLGDAPQCAEEEA